MKFIGLLSGLCFIIAGFFYYNISIKKYKKNLEEDDSVWRRMDGVHYYRVFLSLLAFGLGLILWILTGK